MVSVDDFKSQYVEFEEEADSLVIRMLNEAELSLDKAIYGTKYMPALYALTAHLLYLHVSVGSGEILGVQQVVSEKVGELQINYATTTSKGNVTDDHFLNTLYGRTYLRMRDEVKPKMAVAYRGFQFS